MRAAVALVLAVVGCAQMPPPRSEHHGAFESMAGRADVPRHGFPVVIALKGAIRTQLVESPGSFPERETERLRGELIAAGAEIYVLVSGEGGGLVRVRPEDTRWVLILLPLGQELRLQEDWSVAREYARFPQGLPPQEAAWIAGRVRTREATPPCEPGQLLENERCVLRTAGPSSDGGT